MRCKYCDKKLEPHQYHWDQESEQFVETCKGRCIMSKEDKAELNQRELEREMEELHGLFPEQWVPKN